MPIETGRDKGWIVVPFLLFMLFHCHPAFSEDHTDLPIRVFSNTSRKNVSLGERFRYLTTVSTGADIEIEFPRIPDKLGNFEVRDGGLEQRLAFGKKIIIKWCRLTGYETGEQTIPGQVIRYRGQGGEWQETSSNKVTVTVQSIFERAKIGADIREIEPPVSFGRAYLYHIMAGSVFLVFLIWTGLILIKKREQRLKEIRQGPPEEVLIYDGLNNFILSLHNKKDITGEDFINTAQLTREYLERRFRLPTGGMTTEEFLSSIKAVKEIFEKYGESLDNLLRRCDLMKFANYHPGAEESNRYLSAVRELLDDIKIRPEGESAR